MSPKNRITAVIFDLGRVIVDIDITRLTRLILDDPTEEDIQRTIINAMTDELMLQFNKGQIQPKDFHAQLAAKYNLQIPYEQFVHFWCEIFSPMPGMVDLLSELDGKIKLGLLSDTDPLHWGYLHKTNPILAIFDKPTLSYQVGTTKPNLPIYLAAAKNVNTPPAQCLYIDDLAQNVKGAVNVGMQGIIFKSAQQIRKELKQRMIL